MPHSFTTKEPSIKALLSDKDSKYLIPYYQRQYSWTSDEECQKLWDDILSFAFPTDGNFDSEAAEYYFGSIVMFKSAESQQYEIIDGQQRLITFTLLLRAFYQFLGQAAHQHTEGQNRNRLVDGLVDSIEQCIWILAENMERTEVFRIESKTITDKDRGDFISILNNGLHVGPETKITKKSSNYLKNYKFFLDRISEARDRYPEDFVYLPKRILENCYVLTVEADSQDSALRIFSTLNTRGMPLRDSDIFKAELYKHFDQVGKKDIFIREWSEIEKICSNGINETSMDDLFIRYMRYNVGADKIKMREFYERSISPNGTDQPIKYGMLHSDKTFYCIRMLAHFWQTVFDDDDSMLSKEARKRLFVLKMMPSDTTWKEFVSVYFLKCIEDIPTDKLPYDWHLGDKFVEFLDKTVVYVLALSLTSPGRDAMRSALYRESGNIIRADGINGYTPFNGQSFTESAIRARFDVDGDDFAFDANKKITKPFLAWWMLHYEGNVKSLSLEDIQKDKIQIEHIFPVNRQDVDPLDNINNLESLGNKALIEQAVNSTASDFSFEIKCKIYLKGYKSGRGKKQYPPTKNAELRRLAKESRDNEHPVFPVFKDDEIRRRNSQIVDAFVDSLHSMGLL